MNKNDFLESLLIFVVMTGVLLPVRLFFVTYVSNEWFGSFGIVSAISVVIIVLTKKQKLGKFGRIFEKQIIKLQKGKRGKFVYGQSLLFLLILGGTIYAINLGNSEYVDLKNQLLDEHEEFSDKDKIFEKVEQITVQDWINGFVGMILAVFFAFPQLSAVFAVLNDSTDGWVLHFYTVAFVEYLEIFGILIFYRLTLGKHHTSQEETKKIPRH